MIEKKLITELKEHLAELSRRLGPLRTPLHAYIAGGIAVNYHTGYRMSDDVDIKWSHRVAIPPDMQVFDVENADDPGNPIIMTMDGGFSDVLGSFPPEWEENCTEVAVVGGIAIMVMDPVDLAVSKVARFQDRDRDDIRELAAQGLINPEKFKSRVDEALEFFIGDTTFIIHNAEDALAIIQEEINDCQPE